MDPVDGIIIAVAISVIPTAVSHYLGSRELGKGLNAMRKGFAKMDERFEALLKESSESHTKILEAIRELARSK